MPEKRQRGARDQRDAALEPESTARSGAGGMSRHTTELDALITETIAHALAVAETARDTAELAIQTVQSLAALLEERSRAQDAGSGRPGDIPGGDAPGDALPDDVRDVAVLDAHAGGVSVADYLRDAVLSYSAESQDRGRELDVRLRAARREAARLLAQSRAVQAQSAQVAARRSRARDADPPPGGRARRAANGVEDDPGREDL